MSQDYQEKAAQQLNILNEKMRGIEQALMQVVNHILPNHFWISTQQLEFRECLSYLLQVPPGWLPPTRGWATSADTLFYMAEYALKHKPTTIVECGSGISTLVLARCIELNQQGQLITFDHDNTFMHSTANNLQQRKLDSFVKLIHAPIKTQSINHQSVEWYDIAHNNTPMIDMLFVDGPPMNPSNPLAMTRYPAFPFFVNKLSESATVFVDDVRRDPEKNAVNKWIQENPGWQSTFKATDKGLYILQRK